MKRYFKVFSLLILVFIAQACSRQPKINGGHIITIEQKRPTNTLFYTGSVQPLKMLVVPCPADGVVVETPVQYGEKVNSGQLLFMLSSTKFLTDYKNALTSYIKAKSQFNNSDVQLKEAKFLHTNELISDDEYKTKQSNYYGAQLELLQAKDSLESLMRQLAIKDRNLEKLSIADIDKINQAMHLTINSENLRISSPADGIILAPSKSEEENKKIAKGDAVKQGDALAIIGDMNGLSVRIKVNELTINQLKVGQKVKVSGIAFPNDILAGEIERVDRQGEAASGGLPTFTVEVIVPKLTEIQKKEIHVGMSAKVEINIEDEPQIMVPITAVNENNGMPLVKLYDDKSGKLQEVAVQTGKTTTDAVAILSGLKAGDKIVVSN